MQLKKILPIVLLIVLIFTLSACNGKFSRGVNTSDTFSSNLNTPDKINIYAEGKVKQITKNGDKFEQVLFDRINELVNIKIPKDFSTALLSLSDRDLKEIKSYTVEFIYNKPQSTTIDYGKKEMIQFTEIIFPLTEKWENTALIKKKNNTYIPVGLRENLDYLVRSSIDVLK